MTSDSNNPAWPGGARTADDALLDAARECVLAVGLRRTTLTDVARRAGVSRMTMYRRWPDMASLMADLMTREWTGLASSAMAAGMHDRQSARTRLVASAVLGVRSLRDNAMFRRIVELDPEVLLPYVVDRRGTSQDHILAMLSATIEAGRADGSIRQRTRRCWPGACCWPYTDSCCPSRP